MRVALLTYSTKPRGGVVHTLNLAEALAELGLSVTVWSLARGGDEGFFRSVAPAVELRLVPFETRDDETVTERIVRSIETLRKHFDRAGYDIVHTQDCISASAVGHCVRTIHHLDNFTTPVLAECHERAIVEPYARICVSRAVADEVRQRWGFEPTVIPNGVAAQRFIQAAGPDAAERRAAWRERLGPYVLAVGGIEPRKGSLDLLEAYAILRREHPELTLVFAGGETLFDYREYRDEFDRRAAAIAAPVILGTVAEDELPSLVAAAEVFAFPSVQEGFGLAAMEALAAQRPVIVRELPVLREVFGDAVRYAETSADLAVQLAAALAPDPARAAQGRALAESLTWERAARDHLAFYRAHRIAPVTGDIDRAFR